MSNIENGMKRRPRTARWVALCFTLAGLFGGSTGGAAEPAEDYCRYLGAVTDARQAHLRSPSLLMRGGVVQGGEEATGDGGIARGTVGRTSIGAAYGLEGLWQAELLGRASRAECERYRAEARLLKGLAAAPDVGRGAGLRARVEALQAALVEAGTWLSEAEAARAAALVSDQRVMALRIQIGHLKEALLAARGGLEAVSELEPQALSRLLRAHQEAVVEEASRALDFQLSGWWGLRLSGGYDELWGIEQTVPLFATAQLELNLGRFLEAGAREEARRALQRFEAEGGQQYGERGAAVQRELRARLREEQARLTEVRALLTDLRDRESSLQGMDGRIARDYAVDLGLRRVELEADEAYLQASVKVLAPFLAASGSASAAPIEGETE